MYHVPARFVMAVVVVLTFMTCIQITIIMCMVSANMPDHLLLHHSVCPQTLGYNL